MNAFLIVLTAYTWLHTVSTRQNPRNEASYDLSQFAQSPPESGRIDLALPGIPLPGFPPVRTKVIRHPSPFRTRKYQTDSETVVRILEQEHPIIVEVELVISQGRETEQNLTAVRDIIVAELPRVKDPKVKRQVEEKLAKIEVLLATVREKNDKFETMFRTFVDLVSKGEIRTQKEAHDYLSQLHSLFKVELSSVLSRVETALTDVIRGFKSVLFNAGMLLADLEKFKLRTLELGLRSLGQLFPPFKNVADIIG